MSRDTLLMVTAPIADDQAAELFHVGRQELARLVGVPADRVTWQLNADHRTREYQTIPGGWPALLSITIGADGRPVPPEDRRGDPQCWAEGSWSSSGGPDTGHAVHLALLRAMGGWLDRAGLPWSWCDPRFDWTPGPAPAALPDQRQQDGK